MRHGYADFYWSQEARPEKTRPLTVEVDGERLTVNQVAERTGLAPATIHQRIRGGKTVAEVLAPRHPHRPPKGSRTDPETFMSSATERQDLKLSAVFRDLRVATFGQLVERVGFASLARCRQVVRDLVRMGYVTQEGDAVRSTIKGQHHWRGVAWRSRRDR